MRIFLDANILFSAAKSDGAIRRLLALVMGAGHECWVDGFVVEEARRNLMVKAPASLGELNALLARVHLASFQGDDDSIESQLPLPEKDRPVLAAAIRHGCEALVTGDKSHFGSLYGKTIHDVAIHSPRSLAKYKVRRSRSR
jgi:uncharacterized protein